MKTLNVCSMVGHRGRKGCRGNGFESEALSQEQLSIDHAALFVGPFELIAAPYGSVYQKAIDC